MPEFPDDIQSLLNEAQSDSIVHRIIAIKQLMYMCTNESARALLLILDDIQHLYVFKWVVQYLDEQSILEPMPYLRAMLVSPITEKGRNLHLSALDALKNYSHLPEAQDILAEFLFAPPQHTHGSNRTAAAMRIGTIGTEFALYTLGQVLVTHRDLPTRRSVISGLVKTQQVRAHQILLHVMEDLLHQGVKIENVTLGIGSDIASGIHQLMVRNIMPDDTQYATQVLARWLYVLPARMTGNVVNALNRLGTASAKDALATWQAWDSQEESEDYVSIFR